MSNQLLAGRRSGTPLADLRRWCSLRREVATQPKLTELSASGGADRRPAVRVLGIDVNWAEGGRRVAVARGDENGLLAIVASGQDDTALPALLAAQGREETVVLVDVPIEGCRELSGRHFRPVDMALTRQGVWTLPASRAGLRGELLRESLLSAATSPTVVREVYPYAVYKFLAFLHSRRQLVALTTSRFQALLDSSFRTFVPPKYKRERRLEWRRQHLAYLRDLLLAPELELSFAEPLPDPFTFNALGLLADQYDACLAALPGILVARKSPCVWLVGESASGQILTLADRWLAAQWEKETPVRPAC